MAKVNKDYIEQWYDFDIDVDSRTLWIGSVKKDDDEESGVDYRLAERVIKGLHLLEKSGPNGDRPIYLILNNPGGEEAEGLAIYDAIKACKNHVTVTVYGKAWSMAGYIMQAADHRIMSENSFFMMHEGSRELPHDHPQIVKNWNKWADKVDVICFNIYIDRIREKNPDFKEEKLRKMLKFDTILTAQETIDIGLCDKLLE